MSIYDIMGSIHKLTFKIHYKANLLRVKQSYSSQRSLLLHLKSRFSAVLNHRKTQNKQH